MVFQTIWKTFDTKALDTVQNSAICGELGQEANLADWKYKQWKELREKNVAAPGTTMAVDGGGNVVRIFEEIWRRTSNVPRGTILVLPFLRSHLREFIPRLFHVEHWRELIGEAYSARSLENCSTWNNSQQMAIISF
jgi:hypothetical protein